MKFWEDEKSVLEEGLATLDRVQKFYRQRLEQADANLQFGSSNPNESNGATLEAMQVGVINLCIPSLVTSYFIND